MIIIEKRTAKRKREPEREEGLDKRREQKDVHKEQREEELRKVRDTPFDMRGWSSFWR